METLYPSSLFSACNNSIPPGWLMIQDSSSNGSKILWTKEENKNFERALAVCDEKDPQRWCKIAAMTGKSIPDVMKQYKELEDDVSNIEAGLIPIPGYRHNLKASSSASFTVEWVGNGNRNGRMFIDDDDDDPFRRRLARPLEHERKKGIPWTEEEHRRFLLGLEKHGKGDWRNISRNFVISKTPTQVASHAQKFFLRQSSGAKDKRRPSIHDITTPNFMTEAAVITTALNQIMPMPPASIASLQLSRQYPVSSIHRSTTLSQKKIVLDWTSANHIQPKDEEAAVMVFNASRSLTPEPSQQVTAVREQIVRQSNHPQGSFHYQVAGKTYQLGSFDNIMGPRFKAPSYKVQG